MSTLLSLPLSTVFVVGKQAESESNPYDLVITGLVENPLNFTYNELQRFPMISEVALMKCVGGWTQLYNWTGIPLFFLLSLTGIKSGATEIVFYASDGFSSSLTIERALHPTTILALQLNGTVLSNFDGGPYRLVVPCKYGYKWVRWLTEIEVVDYDYKGHYESMGYSDEADIPDCTLPSTTPQFETFPIAAGNPIRITILSNSTIDSFDFDMSEGRISLNVTGESDTKGYCYVTIPKTLLWCDNLEQWQVWANGMLIEDRRILEDTNSTFLYFDFNQRILEVQIRGVHVISSFPSDLNIDGTVDIFDVVILANAFGSTQAYSNWNPLADLNDDAVVDIFDVVLLANSFGSDA